MTLVNISKKFKGEFYFDFLNSFIMPIVPIFVIVVVVFVLDASRSLAADFVMMFVSFSLWIPWLVIFRRTWTKLYPPYQYSIRISNKGFNFYYQDELFHGVNWSDVRKVEVFRERENIGWIKYYVIRFITTSMETEEVRLYYLKMKKKQRRYVISALPQILQKLEIPYIKTDVLEEGTHVQQKQRDYIQRRRDFRQRVIKEKGLANFKLRNRILLGMILIMIISLLLYFLGNSLQ